MLFISINFNVIVLAVEEENLTDTSESNSISYTFDSGILSIEGTGEISGSQLTEDEWQSYKTNTTEIIIGDGIQSIEDYSFQDFIFLQTISLPDSITKLGTGTFYNCQSLTNITIPNSVTEIGENAFELCLGITSIEIPEGVTKINSNTFKFCRNLKEITLPTSLKEIASNAFDYCDSLSELDIPNEVENIGEYAFKQCEGLLNLSISENLSSIKEGAFKNCRKLDNIIIPNKITSIGNSAFANCNNLKSVIIADNVLNIGNDNFNESEDVFFCGIDGSYAQGYAQENNIDFYNVYVNSEMEVGSQIQLPQIICSEIVSSAPEVVSVSSTGCLTALTKGSAIITVTINDNKINFPVEVNEKTCRLIVINGTGSGIYESGTQVNINVNPELSDFSKWSVQTGDAVITTEQSSETALTVGTSDTIVIAAAYEDELPDFCIFKQDETGYYNSDYGVNVNYGQPVVIQDGRTFIPLRTVSMGLGAEVNYYDAGEKSYVDVVYNQQKVQFIIKDYIANVYDMSGNLTYTATLSDTETPRFIDGKLYLSARSLHGLCFWSTHKLYYVAKSDTESAYVIFSKQEASEAKQEDMISILETLISL